MKKFMALAAFLTVGSAAYANNKAHEECLKAVDYKGCLEARLAIRKSVTKAFNNSYFTKQLPPYLFKRLTTTGEDGYYAEQSNKEIGILKNKCYDALPDKLSELKTTICSFFVSKSIDVGQPINSVDYLNDRLQRAIDEWTDPKMQADAAKHNAKIDQQNELDEKNHTPSINKNTASCQPGKSLYQKRWLFGLIKGGTMCLTDFEAESLKAQRRQSLQNSLNNMNNNKPTSCYGTANTIGSTTYTQANCY